MIYHTRHDIYHCCYRILSILSFTETEKLETDKIRIIDFYLVFPSYVQDITFPRGNSISKKLLGTIEPSFEYLPNKKILFSELREFQSHALQILKAKEIIKIEGSFIKKGNSFEQIAIKISENSRFKESDFFSELIKKLLLIDVLGENGLKKRTTLMEYRYDPI